MDDKKISQRSRPLLDEPLDSGDEIGYAEKSIWRSDAERTRRDDGRRVKIIILALSVAYIPLVILYLKLFAKVQSPVSLDNIRPSDLFPCKRSPCSS